MYTRQVRAVLRRGGSKVVLTFRSGGVEVRNMFHKEEEEEEEEAGGNEDNGRNATDADLFGGDSNSSVTGDTESNSSNDSNSSNSSSSNNGGDRGRIS